MATSKKTFRKNVTRVMESDIFHSIAIVSVILNILLLVGVYVLSSTDTFGRNFYDSARTKYCQNIDGITDRAEQLKSEKAAVKEWQITCISKEFKPFYDEATAKFDAQYPN